MRTIRTAEEFARAYAAPLDPELKAILQAHMDRLAEWLDDYTLQELAEFIIFHEGDTLAEVEAALGRRLVGGGAAAFAIPAEYVQQHSSWFEAVFILSDDGFGLVLLVEVGAATDAKLLAACRKSLQQIGSPAVE
jgi:hypothetical protein